MSDVNKEAMMCDEKTESAWYGHNKSRVVVPKMESSWCADPSGGLMPKICCYFLYFESAAWKRQTATGAGDHKINDEGQDQK
mmetsp:Transcript_9678/g.16787  ORF Transcript_9678/g.16787 Transcript_9678/m.16787 type:complete len:82 (+) Transcript_9678:167-412(+)